jgi:hypothetical protein
MAGPRNEMAAGGGHGRLRASHADREHAIETLKAAYVHGLVTKDEFDARVSQTFASRTNSDLALITADIPAGLAAAPPPGPARTGGDAPADVKVRPLSRAVMRTAMLAALALAASVFTPNPVAGLLVLGAIGSAFASLFLIVAQMLRPLRDKRSGGQLPPQRAIRTGPGHGRRAAAPNSAGQLPSASEPRQTKADAARSRLPHPQLSS